MDKDLLGEFEDMRTNSVSSLSKAKENGKKNSISSLSFISFTSPYQYRKASSPSCFCGSWSK